MVNKFAQELGPVGVDGQRGGEAEMSRDLTGKFRPGDGRSTDHEVLASGHFLTSFEVIKGPNIAVGDDRDGGVCVDLADWLPVDRGLVALGSGSCMDGDPSGSRFFGLLGVDVDWLDGVPSESHFDANWDDGVDGRSDGVGDFVDSLGAPEEACAAIVAIDDFGGATKVDVDRCGSGGNGVLGRGRHVVGVSA